MEKIGDSHEGWGVMGSDGENGINGTNGIIMGMDD